MLNEERIAELKDEVGADDFEEIVTLFCEEVEEMLDELSTTSPTQMADKLHFLKGSALNIGLDAVGEMCRNAENRLKTNRDAAPDIAAIRKLYLASRIQLLA